MWLAHKHLIHINISYVFMKLFAHSSCYHYVILTFDPIYLRQNHSHDMSIDCCMLCLTTSLCLNAVTWIYNCALKATSAIASEMHICNVTLLNATSSYIVLSSSFLSSLSSSCNSVISQNGTIVCYLFIYSSTNSGMKCNFSPYRLP